jgi:D-glycero-D-manno-heptose 1,7-bisphosphate phosphatase
LRSAPLQPKLINMSKVPRLVILDRDGVINEDSDNYIKSPEEWVPIPGSLEAIARLNNAGAVVTVATNQSGIGRGLFSINELNRIHAKFRDALARVGGHVDGIFFCPHTPEAQCECRKPAPGLLRAISLRFATGLRDIPMIGDSLRDIEAARAANANPVLVRSGKGMFTQQNPPDFPNVPCFDDLADAVDHLLSDQRHS